MILIFGPTGSGKSMQGKLLAARNNWQWLSAGQLLRDEHDPELIEEMKLGELVDPARVNQVVAKSLSKLESTDNLILDGYPRMMQQAKFLVESLFNSGSKVKFAIVLDVPRETLVRRLLLRARADDNQQAINARLDQYDHDMPLIYSYLEQNNITVIHVNGDDSIGRVHDNIMQTLSEKHLL